MMKTITILLSLLISLLLAVPANAYSSLAEKFIELMYSENPFPPDDWTKQEIRTAALEVLEGIETGNAREPLSFTLLALGYTCYAEDLDRILIYQETMPLTVLRALRGYPDPKAIECLLNFTRSMDEVEREQAYIGLGEIDFDCLNIDNPDELRQEVLSQLEEIRVGEKVDWLLKRLDEAILKLES